MILLHFFLVPDSGRVGAKASDEFDRLFDDGLAGRDDDRVHGKVSNLDKEEVFLGGIAGDPLQFRVQLADLRRRTLLPLGNALRWREERERNALKEMNENE